MNKKLLVAYALAAVLVVYVVHVYRSKNNTAPTATEAVVEGASVTTTPEVPVNKEAEATRAHNEELVKKYTEQIAAGKDTDAEGYYQRGLAYMNLEQYRAAIQDFDSSLRIAPESAEALYARALAYQSEKQLDNALTDLNAAIKLKADFAAAYNTRAVIYDEQNKTDEAINDYKNAIAINPNLDQAYYNLGILYEKQKQYTEAEAEYTNAISNNKAAANATAAEIAAAKKRLEQAYVHRSSVYLATNDLSAALKDVNYVIEHDAKNEAAYRLRSEIYNKMGNTADSLADKATADNLSMQNLLEQRKAN